MNPDNTTYTVFITGANRGIGLEFVKQYAKLGWKIFASYRNESSHSDLRFLQSNYSSITLLPLELKSEEEFSLLAAKMKDIPIDVLINNAGYAGNKTTSIDKITQQELIDHFVVNAAAPLLLSKTLIPNLHLGKLKTILSISSYIASVSENVSGAWNVYSYKASKAALNMLMRCLAAEPIYNDLRLLLLDPGWVKTDMGGQGAEIDVTESVKGMREIVLNPSFTTDSFIDYRGNKVPW